MLVRRFLQRRVLPYFGGDRRHARLAFIQAYDFPDTVRARFAAETPALTEDQRAQVFAALKDYFALCAADPDTPAAMPSRIVDEAWHTFILFTRDYADFCERAFGRYLHHAPGGAHGDEDLKQTWRLACAREGIPSNRPIRLPRLFAIDRQLAIPNGRYYALNDTDADMTRRVLGATAIVYLAASLGGGDAWHDPIFHEAYAAHDSTPFGGGEFAGGGDAGFSDVSGSGGCSGSGS